MTEEAKKHKFTVSMDADVYAELTQIADKYYAGNLSAALEDAAREKRDAMTGPMSKVWAFLAEIRRTLRGIGFETTSPENGVDWVIPSLRVGIEAKMKPTPGRAEQTMISAMAFTVGQGQCDELWIVGADSMPDADRQ